MEIIREPRGEHLGARVRMLRTLMGLNQKRLCEALGLSVEELQDFENGLACIDARQTERLAVELNVPLAFFSRKPRG